MDQVDPTQFSLLEAEVDGIKNELTEFRAEVRAYFSRSSLRSIWPMVTGVSLVLWFVLNLQINSTVKSVDDKATRTQTQLDALVTIVTKNNETIPILMQQNASSLQDRTDQRQTLSHLSETQSHILEANARSDAERQANEREVETQIDAMNQSLSVQFANQQRTNADHQNALHELGAVYPAASSGPFYFPNISNRNHRKQ